MTRTPTALFVFALIGAQFASGQGPLGAEEDYKVYTEAPRLFLRPHRLRLLRRERERQSIRWQQFQLLMAGNAKMPEPAFASALYYEITGDEARGRQAIESVLDGAPDLRELAIVADWCGKLLTPPQSQSLYAKLEAGLTATQGAADIGTVRSRVLAAIVLADKKPSLTESVLRETIVAWWRGRIVPEIEAGRDPIPLNGMFALLELLHAVRDNLNIELRDNAPGYFKDLPTCMMLSHYPAPYPAPENLYRIPAYSGSAGPDLSAAALSRAAGLALVAYDTNALGNQYLQGWLIQDQYLLRSAFGAPYEFLWANPYQPGLSYYHVPLVFHDPRGGRLFARSSWEDDALWFGLFDHRRQLFQNGKVHQLGSGDIVDPVRLGVATILPGVRAAHFTIDDKEPETVYIVGLKPQTAYEIEVDDQEMREDSTDAAGTLELLFPTPIQAGVRVHLPSYPMAASRKN